MNALEAQLWRVARAAVRSFHFDGIDRSDDIMEEAIEASIEDLELISEAFQATLEGGFYYCAEPTNRIFERATGRLRLALELSKLPPFPVSPSEESHIEPDVLNAELKKSAGLKESVDQPSPEADDDELDPTYHQKMSLPERPESEVES